ncbi:MAG: N-acetylglucosamine kinase [Longimicrobiales bacterium]
MIVVGVDGGGTRSRALLVDEQGTPLGAADGGPGIILPDDPMAAASAVEDVVRRAAGGAGIALPVDALWAGLAGAGRAEGREAVIARLKRRKLATRVDVGGDVEAGHADAFGDGPGVLLVVGTGSMVYAMAPSGVPVTVGGWGDRLGDEGSGYRIGLEALQGIVRSADGRETATELTDVVLPKIGVSEPRGLLDWTGRAKKGDIAALSPLVAEVARKGDVIAARIIHRALTEVRALLEAVLARTSGWDGPPGLALVGGLLRGPKELRVPVIEMGRELGFEVLEDRVIPERGAAVRARGLIG